MRWTDDQKEIFRHLIPTKKLLFLTANSGLKVFLKGHNLEEYDYIVVFSEFYKYYIICKANLHIGKQGIDFDSAKKIIKKKETGIVSKRINQCRLYEKCLVFPWETETKVCKDIDRWFNYVLPINDNGKMKYGYYNEKTQMIEDMELKEV